MQEFFSIPRQEVQKNILFSEELSMALALPSLFSGKGEAWYGFMVV